jgi:gas vesicle protein
MDASKLLAAFIIGAAVGVSVGMLLAPDKGSETRRKIKEKGREVADTLQQKMKEGKEKVDEWKEKMSQKHTATAGNGGTV